MTTQVAPMMINPQKNGLDHPVGDKSLLPTCLSILEYDALTYVEKDNVSIDECLEHMIDPPITWIQVYGLNDHSIIKELANRFKIHPLASEDILNTNQRPKLDVYQDQLFLTMRILLINERGSLTDEQLCLIVGNHYLISFSKEKNEFFNMIKDKLRQSNQRIRTQGSDYLAYSIIDAVVDQYFSILESIDNQTVALEHDIMHASNPLLIQKIQKSRREMIFLRKSIWPLRDMVSQFEKIENPLVSHTTQLYLRDVYDHVIRIMDMIEGMKDMVGGMLDIHLSNINIRTNEIMKFLTIVSTIFVPLTFISSVYGMNFKNIPELNFKYGYPIALLVMLGIAARMLHYFRQKKWI